MWLYSPSTIAKDNCTQPLITVIARVTGIANGGTLYLNIDERSTRLRLIPIDAPEKIRVRPRLNRR